MKCQEPHKLISQVDLANMCIINQMVGDVGASLDGSSSGRSPLTASCRFTTECYLLGMSSLCWSFTCFCGCICLSLGFICASSCKTSVKNIEEEHLHC